MLRTCNLDFGGSWDQHLTLIEYAYNNSYHSSVRTAQHEALYRRKYRSLVYVDEIGERKILDSNRVPWIKEAYAKVNISAKNSTCSE